MYTSRTPTLAPLRYCAVLYYTAGPYRTIDYNMENSCRNKKKMKRRNNLKKYEIFFLSSSLIILYAVCSLLLMSADFFLLSFLLPMDSIKRMKRKETKSRFRHTRIQRKDPPRCFGSCCCPAYKGPPRSIPIILINSYK